MQTINTLASRILKRANPSLTQQQIFNLINEPAIRSQQNLSQQLDANKSYTYAARNSDGSIDFKLIA